MRKDIQIPKITGVSIAAVYEFNQDHRTHDWNVYLINELGKALEMVLIVSKGYDDQRETSLLRHKLPVLPAKGYAKIEFLEESVLVLNNVFKLTFFIENKMFEQEFIFNAGAISEANLTSIPVIPQKGILAK